MDSLVGFYIYALTFRLAIIAAGIVSIVLGYKLFVIGVMGEGRANVNAQAGPVKLTLDNAGPGLVFALFGAFIITVMLIQGNPEYLKEEYQNQTSDRPAKAETVTGKQSNVSQPKTREPVSIIRTRSGSDNEDASTDQEWDKLDKPNITLSEAAEPLSNIARIWQQEKRTGEAVAMARLAARYSTEEDKLNHLALLGETLFENGDEQEAVSVMQTVADRDPLYRQELARMQERLEEKKN
ncbi:hypothetical protein KKHLCK_14130 [Candidatus Electrothrix laxa]